MTGQNGPPTASNQSIALTLAVSCSAGGAPNNPENNFWLWGIWGKRVSGINSSNSLGMCFSHQPDKPGLL